MAPAAAVLARPPRRENSNRLSGSNDRARGLFCVEAAAEVRRAAKDINPTVHIRQPRGVAIRR